VGCQHAADEDNYPSPLLTVATGLQPLARRGARCRLHHRRRRDSMLGEYIPSDIVLVFVGLLAVIACFRCSRWRVFSG